jgi:hypothetical protein
MIASAPLDPHARARLVRVQDLLIAAHDADAVALAVIELVTLLQDEWGQRDHPAVQLVRDAYELFTNPESRIRLVEWIRAAEPYVRSE